MKANIGHANTAAGALGFLKMVLQLRHAMITPIAHLARESDVNPDLRQSAGKNTVNVRFPTDAVPWNSTENLFLRGAVSSFGIGGANVHVILERKQSRP